MAPKDGSKWANVTLVRTGTPERMERRKVPGDPTGRTEVYWPPNTYLLRCKCGNEWTMKAYDNEFDKTKIKDCGECEYALNRRKPGRQPKAPAERLAPIQFFIPLRCYDYYQELAQEETRIRRQDDRKAEPATVHDMIREVATGVYPELGCVCPLGDDRAPNDKRCSIGFPPWFIDLIQERAADNRSTVSAELRDILLRRTEPITRTKAAVGRIDRAMSGVI